uniref:'chromo' domain containing protein n=1 Tax=Steinernema glaseri TaxID=37863 RepID=A0A1I8AL34_9BILA
MQKSLHCLPRTADNGKSSVIEAPLTVRTPHKPQLNEAERHVEHSRKTNPDAFELVAQTMFAHVGTQRPINLDRGLAAFFVNLTSLKKPLANYNVGNVHKFERRRMSPRLAKLVLSARGGRGGNRGGRGFSRGWDSRGGSFNGGFNSRRGGFNARGGNRGGDFGGRSSKNGIPKMQSTLVVERLLLLEILQRGADLPRILRDHVFRGGSTGHGVRGGASVLGLLWLLLHVHEHDVADEALQAELLPEHSDGRVVHEGIWN